MKNHLKFKSKIDKTTLVINKNSTTLLRDLIDFFCINLSLFRCTKEMISHGIYLEFLYYKN